MVYKILYRGINFHNRNVRLFIIVSFNFAALVKSEYLINVILEQLISTLVKQKYNSLNQRAMLDILLRSVLIRLWVIMFSQNHLWSLWTVVL